MIKYIYITINLINKKVHVEQKLSNKCVPTYFGSDKILKKLQKLKGMVIYKLEESVETRCDECSTVG